MLKINSIPNVNKISALPIVREIVLQNGYPSMKERSSTDMPRLLLYVLKLDMIFTALQ